MKKCKVADGQVKEGDTIFYFPLHFRAGLVVETTVVKYEFTWKEWWIATKDRSMLVGASAVFTNPKSKQFKKARQEAVQRHLLYFEAKKHQVELEVAEYQAKIDELNRTKE